MAPAGHPGPRTGHARPEGTTRATGSLRPVRFAVIIPAFNNGSAAVVTAMSALSIDGVSEVIVVDDGSTDGTAEQVAQIDDPRVRLVRRANGGPSAARNSGAWSASASHLVFLDVEDLLLPCAIERFTFHQNQGCRLVRSGVVRVGPDGTERVVLAQASNFAYPRGTPLPGSFSIEHDLFESIGGYDDELRFGENSDLLLRAQSALLRSGETVGFCGEPTVRVNVNPAHDTAYYRRPRLAAIERMLSVHRDELDLDHETLHNHHAIAAVLYRQEGSLGRANRHAWAAMRIRPRSVRSWVRLGLTATAAARTRRTSTPGSGPRL